MASKSLTFEKALEELENITKRLEEGKESLEDSMKLYERGVELKSFCEKSLKQAESKWAILRKKNNGEIEAQEVSSERIPESNELFEK